MLLKFNSVICFLFQSFLFAPTVDVDIVLDGQDTRKLVEMKVEDGKKENCYLYFDGESVAGKVRNIWYS